MKKTVARPNPDEMTNWFPIWVTKKGTPKKFGAVMFLCYYSNYMLQTGDERQIYNFIFSSKSLYEVLWYVKNSESPSTFLGTNHSGTSNLSNLSTLKKWTAQITPGIVLGWGVQNFLLEKNTLYVGKMKFPLLLFFYCLLS